MRKYKFILTLLVFILFCSGSCEEKTEPSFIIKNNSEQEIMVFSSYSSWSNECLKGNISKKEYENMIYYRAIAPFSNKNLSNLRRSIETSLTDTTFIGVFNRIDIDTMSCEEFKHKFPLKKEWKVTLADMKANDWTLEYTP